MSRIYIHVYDGDSEQYDSEFEIESIGTRQESLSRTFGDGEKLEAAAMAVRLLAHNRHFDVRQVTD